MAMTRDPGPSKNQSHTYDSWGLDEDISPIVVSLSPDETPILSTTPDGPNAVEPSFSWPTEELHPPQVNKHLEKEDYTSHPVGSMESLDNVVQIFMTSGYVTDMQRKARKVYKGGDDEFDRQLTKAFKEHARDIEYAFLNNDQKVAGTSSVAAMTGGLPYFMSKKTMSATVDTSSGVVTCSAEHNLKTGDFVYVDAATMPTGLKKNTLYYVRLDDTTPATKFTLFPSMKAAVENVTAKKIIPTSAGTSLVIVLNNVHDLNNEREFTVADINIAMEMAYRRGGDPHTMWASPRNKARFSEIVNAMSYTTRKSGEKKSNLIASTLETDFGVITCKPHRWFPNDMLLLLDQQYLEKKWFERTHKVPGLAKKGNYTEFVIESTIGLKFDQPLSSAAIANIKE